MTPRRVVAVSGGVITLAALVLLAAGRDAADALTLSVVPGCAALGVGGIGAGVLDRLRHRTFAEQVAAVALVAVATAATGGLVVTMTMPFAADELLALSLAIAVAATVAVITALALAARVMRAAALLQDAARHIGDDDAHVTTPVDIRELAEVGDEIESVAMRLAAERARRELVSWVSHDLRSPLAGIRAIADALADGVLDDGGAAVHVHRLRMETERLTNLVDDLAQLSRMETGRLELELEPVSLCDLVSDALAAAQPIAESKGVRVRGRILARPPPAPLAAHEISRVLANLLDNAVRATPRGGSISVEVDADETGATVHVIDECGGFSPEVATGAQRGLGLVIARGFVEAHGGELSVSRHGAGCRHVVRLPHRRPDHTRQAAATSG